MHVTTLNEIELSSELICFIPNILPFSLLCRDFPLATDPIAISLKLKKASAHKLTFLIHSSNSLIGSKDKSTDLNNIYYMKLD